MLIQIIS